MLIKSIEKKPRRRCHSWIFFEWGTIFYGNSKFVSFWVYFSRVWRKFCRVAFFKGRDFCVFGKKKNWGTLACFCFFSLIIEKIGIWVLELFWDFGSLVCNGKLLFIRELLASHSRSMGAPKPRRRCRLFSSLSSTQKVYPLASAESLLVRLPHGLITLSRGKGPFLSLFLWLFFSLDDRVYLRLEGQYTNPLSITNHEAKVIFTYLKLDPDL